MINSSGVSLGLKNFVKYKIPDMRTLRDISDFILDDATLEDDILGMTDITQDIKSGNVPAGSASIRLFEIGPRISLKVAKIYEGVGDKEVIYHSNIQKTDSEKEELRSRHKNRLYFKSANQKVA
ncbi:hypothetical protein HZS_6694 [Henneguya salminicola]|nr:hypothetical protein HZS_6694 [Henneguya salminicola]